MQENSINNQELKNNEEEKKMNNNQVQENQKINNNKIEEEKEMKLNEENLNELEQERLDGLAEMEESLKEYNKLMAEEEQERLAGLSEMKEHNKAVKQQEINEVLKIYENYGYSISELSQNDKEELEIISLRNYKMMAEKEKMDIQFNTIQDILILTGNNKMYELERISETECKISSNEYPFPLPFLTGNIEEIRKFFERIINPNK